MLGNLRRIIEYCINLNVDALTPVPHVVADESQGTTVLNSPTLTGPQIVISMPMARLSGSCDGMTGPHTFIIYTLDKARDLTSTRNEVVGQYLATADLLSKLLRKFAADIGGQSSPGVCPLLAGMEFKEVEVMPAAGVFGGWNGYSAAITLK